MEDGSFFDNEDLAAIQLGTILGIGAICWRLTGGNCKIRYVETAVIPGDPTNFVLRMNCDSGEGCAGAPYIQSVALDAINANSERRYRHSG
jgi:hypothetical protein